jgi:hypothetical protein
MQFLQHPVTSSLLGQNIFNFLFSKTQPVCVLPSVGEKFYIHTTGRIIVLCIGTYTFLDSRQEVVVVVNRPEIDSLH